MAKAKKTTKKAQPKSKKMTNVIEKTRLLPKPARAVALRAVGIIDERILKIASKQYQKMAKEMSRRSANGDFDQKLVMKMGEQILNRAQAVRKSLKEKKTKKKKPTGAEV